ncbi:MAG TPA: magnesium transporter [Polyangiaceae bacterium]|nr:magnesium transporter [Polyangiaceae bacterium]
MAEAAEDQSQGLSNEDLRDAWIVLSNEDRKSGFLLLSREDQEEFFEGLTSRDQVSLLLSLPPAKRRSLIRLLAPDDAADVIQAADPEDHDALIELFDGPTREEVNALLAYEEDAAGGLMSTRYARVRPDMTVGEAIGYLRKQARTNLETLYYVYVLDDTQHLLGVVSLRELFASEPSARVKDIMHRDFLFVRADQDQESVSRVFAENDLVAIPVVDAEGRIQGIVTIDDIVDVVQEEATEDIQKIGGTEALDGPYLTVDLVQMVRKRAGWLSALFLGEMLTASAMAHFEDEIARAVVLALFVPLIISSGGNSGSQATTIVIRAMALGELRLRDWWRVARREVTAGVILGIALGSIGFLRIVLWQMFSPLYGPHYMLVAMTVAGSLVGVVTFGTVAGSLLPFVLKRFGFDPASASAPFVATLVDVSGLVIYFTVASIILRNTLL